MYTPQVAAFAGVNVPIVPMAHQYLITEPLDGVPDDLPQLRDPDRLVYFRRESGGLVVGGYERDPAPWSVDGVPEDFNNKLLQEDWDRFAPLMSQRVRARARGRARADRVARQRSGSVHPGQRVHPRRERGARVLRRGRVLRPRDRGCGRRRPGDGRVDPRRRAELRHLAHGHPPVRRAVPQPRARPSPGRSRCTRPTTTSTTRTRSGTRAGRCGAPPRTTGSPHSAARSARRACGSDRTGSSRTRSAATSMLRPRGWAGEHWSPAIVAEALACRDTAALFDETSFSKLELSGPGAVAFLNRLCGQRDGPAGRLGDLHPALQRARAASSATSPRPGWTRQRYLLVTGTAFGQPRPRLGAQAAGAAARGRRGRRPWTSRRATRASGSGVRRAREILAPLTRADLGNDAFPYLSAQRITVGRVPGHRAAGHVRRRARLGAVLPDRVRHRVVGRALGRGRAARDARRRLPRDRRAAGREGLPRLVERHHARGQPVPGRARLRGEARQGTRLRRA